MTISVQIGHASAVFTKTMLSLIGKYIPTGSRSTIRRFRPGELEASPAVANDSIMALSGPG